ncbi:winged helix-turn-helix domain-containing protein [Bifidobacterium sp. SO1]|uniref:winged helix-turn-helix transcriptional regulator n=1 Tax=Bifidobacterium sp. SO1 TaxID=2809029 RepID=UPI001BDD089F|nr:winged helix-turn-helix domain-containing protein [Bifidobacterium sp. SO1]MBT1160890.1 response regulator transcription factor [Bifidobacterium sp. SO1]
MDLLVVTGSAALASALERTLETAGHQATVVTSVTQLDELFRDYPLLPFDAVVLDDLTPAAVRDGLARRLHDPGISLGRRIRIALLSTPSLSASSRPATGSPVAAPLTPDVTVVKPFGDTELLSYISLLQTIDDAPDGDATANGPALLIHGDLTLDTRRQRAYYRGGKPIALSPREYSALEALIRADGDYLSFDDLSRLVFGDGAGFADQRTVMDTTMYSLTRKLRRLGFFITQHGHQYRIR